MEEQISAEVVAKVIQALDDQKFRWRTVAGVARDAGVQVETVRQVIAQSGEQVIRSGVPSSDGQDLYTTREKFRSFATLSERLLGAIKNRAV